MCESSGTAVTDAELERAMEQLDEDNSGEVDQEEFTKYFKEHRQEKGGVMAGMMALFAALQEEEAAAATADSKSRPPAPQQIRKEPRREQPMTQAMGQQSVNMLQNSNRREPTRTQKWDRPKLRQRNDSVQDFREWP